MNCVNVRRVCVNCVCVSVVIASCLYASVVGCLCVLGNLYVYITFVILFFGAPCKILFSGFVMVAESVVAVVMYKYHKSRNFARANVAGQ